MIIPSQFEGAVMCNRCLTHMHPSNGDRHMARHLAQDVLKVTTTRLLNTLSSARIVEKGNNVRFKGLGNDLDEALIAQAELDRRNAQAALDELNKL